MALTVGPALRRVPAIGGTGRLGQRWASSAAISWDHAVRHSTRTLRIVGQATDSTTSARAAAEAVAELGGLDGPADLGEQDLGGGPVRGDEESSLVSRPCPGWRGDRQIPHIGVELCVSEGYALVDREEFRLHAAHQS